MKFGNKEINENETIEILNEIAADAQAVNESLIELLQLIKNSDMKQLFGEEQLDEV